MSSPVIATATLNDPSGTALQGNSFVRFILRNYQGFVPRVTNTSIIAETQIDALPNSSGIISQNLWGNNSITPNTTFYTVQFWDQGRITSQGNYLFNANTNLNTAAQLNTPPVPPGFSLVLENNSVLNSSQSTLNLVNTDGSVVITDLGWGSIQLSAEQSGLATVGQGGFAGPGITLLYPYYGQSLSSTPAGTTNNQITVFQFVLNSSFTISKVTSLITTGAAGASVNFGIYSPAGNKLLDSGALNATTSNSAVSNTLGSPVALSSGVYLFAQSTSNTGVQVPGLATTSVAATNMLNLHAVRIGQTANSTSAGVMPATLGTITADSLYLNAAVPFFEV